MRHCAVYFSLAAMCAAATPGEPPPASTRRTELVKLIERSSPAIVTLNVIVPTNVPNVVRIAGGSGVVIHESGYVLTNAHVVGAGDGTVHFSDGRAFRYKVVAAMAYEDLAVIRVEGGGAFPSLPLGRSNDLMLGEPTLIIGSPGGLAQSVSTGIVSGLNRINATDFTLLRSLIQTTAAVNSGNSGGPLINSLGELIGVVSSKKNDAEGIGFAIAIDRVREVFGQMISAELRYGFLLGITVDALESNARVTGVAEGSPAAMAGVQRGDVVRKMDDHAIRHAIDFHLALVGRKVGQTVRLELEREGKPVPAQTTLVDFPVPAPSPEEGLVPGLQFSAYKGRWAKLPDFASEKATEDGVADRPGVNAYKGPKDEFGLKFEGFIKVPAEGLYQFSTRSDDGSRLYLGKQLVVDNDGLHAASEAIGLIRLPKGLQPITVTFFEAGGEEVLQTFVTTPDGKKQEIPPQWFFHREPKPPAATP